MSKTDFIQDCMDSMPQQGSLDDFKKAFCDVCINADCHRSRFTDSKWVTRMLMQEQALFNPSFADVDDPRYDHLRGANFETIDAPTLKYYGGWVDIKEDGTVVHHGEAEPEETDASKFDQAVSSLRGGREPVKEEPEEVHAPEPEPVVEVEQPDPVVERAPARPKRQVPPQQPRNTEMPQSGIILGPQKVIARPSHLLKPASDPWAVDSGGTKRGKNGKLTVRVSDGKVKKD